MEKKYISYNYSNENTTESNDQKSQNHIKKVSESELRMVEDCKKEQKNEERKNEERNKNKMQNLINKYLISVPKNDLDLNLINEANINNNLNKEAFENNKEVDKKEVEGKAIKNFKLK